MVDSKENYKFDVGVKVLGYKHLSSYSSFQSVGFWGGRGAKKVSFTAYYSCRLQLLHIIFVLLNSILSTLTKEIHLRTV